MDKNSFIGFGLIVAILVGFSIWQQPSKEQLAQQQAYRDSVALVRQQTQAAIMAAAEQATMAEEDTVVTVEEQQVVLENEKVRLTLSNKGGKIARAELKEYKAYGDSVNNLTLFRADESLLSFTLITQSNHILATDKQNFTILPVNDSTIIMRWQSEVEDAYLDIRYTLAKDDYMVGISLEAHNLQQVLAQNMSSLEMIWRQKISQKERGRKFEERYARLQYRTMGGDVEELSESKHDSEKESAKVQWIAYKDQFFSTVLIAEEAFSGSSFESTPGSKHSAYLKEYETKTSVDFDLTGRKPTQMRMYVGPNHYKTLNAYEGLELETLVPLGWKLISWVNYLIIIPIFDILRSTGWNIGLVIFLLTLCVKLIVLPFVFKSYQSTAKMRVLKPQIEEINAKYPKPEQMQERQTATMALYSRAGASPMSGCLPMLLQMPILMAVFWFFPTAIELRGQSFLWAEDLSTYDAIIQWGFNIPVLGDHLSLFCILFTLVNVAYTYVNMQQQAGANDPNMKMMQYMMYFMPIMFFFIFNDYPAGLSYYYLLSMFITILQMMIFRWTTDDEKLLEQMRKTAAKKASKPKSGFMAKLEELQREQQRLAREQAKAAQRR